MELNNENHFNANTQTIRDDDLNSPERRESDLLSNKHIEKTISGKNTIICKFSPERLNSTCRYCLEGNELEQMIAPCKCSGSLKYVHKSCMKERIKSFQSNNFSYEEGWICLTCELCKEKIKYCLIYENGLVYSMIVTMYMLMTSIKGISLLIFHIIVVYFCLDKFRYLGMKALNFFFEWKFKVKYLLNYSNEISICFFLTYLLKEIIYYYLGILYNQRKENYQFKKR